MQQMPNRAKIVKILECEVLIVTIHLPSIVHIQLFGLMLSAFNLSVSIFPNGRMEAFPNEQDSHLHYSI